MSSSSSTAANGAVNVNVICVLPAAGANSAATPTAAADPAPLHAATPAVIPAAALNSSALNPAFSAPASSSNPASSSSSRPAPVKTKRASFASTLTDLDTNAGASFQNSSSTVAATKNDVLDDSHVDDLDSHSSASYLFKWLIITQILVYIEAGALPALLNMIRHDFAMSYMSEGALGGFIYLFLSATSPIAGYLFRHYDAKLVMGTSLFCNSAATLLFALTPAGQTFLLISARCAIGATQAFLMVFTPVWVNEFAPADKRTTWMAYLQASVPSGVMVGYCIATFCTFLLSDSDSMCSLYGCYRWPFVIQVLLTTPIAIACFFVPSPHLDIHAAHMESSFFTSPAMSSTPFSAETEAELSRSLYAPQAVITMTDEGESAAGRASADDDSKFSLLSPARASMNSLDISLNQLKHAIDRNAATSSVSVAAPLLSPTAASSTPSSSSAYLQTSRVRRRSSVSCGRSLCRLLQNGVYVFVMLALTDLYWVVTGIQWWCTDYVITVLHGNRHEVRILFIITAATSPILGVFAGGWLVEVQGGHIGVQQRLTALKMCTVFGSLACICAFPAAFTDSLATLFLLVWLLLFFGACALPASVGVLLTCVDDDLRYFASSFSVLVFNVLGYFSAPVLSAWIMEVSDSFQLGFRIILGSAVFSMLALGLALYFAWCESRHKSQLLTHIIVRQPRRNNNKRNSNMQQMVV